MMLTIILKSLARNLLRRDNFCESTCSVLICGALPIDFLTAAIDLYALLLTLFPTIVHEAWFWCVS